MVHIRDQLIVVFFCFPVAKNFSHSLRRQTSLTHLAQVRKYINSGFPIPLSFLYSFTYYDGIIFSPSSVCTFFRSQAARTVLHSAEPVSQMLNDWKQIDFEGIARQALWAFNDEKEEDYELINERKKSYFLLIC